MLEGVLETQIKSVCVFKTQIKGVLEGVSETQIKGVLEGVEYFQANLWSA